MPVFAMALSNVGIIAFALLLTVVSGSDPNFKNIFKQTTTEVQNQELNDVSGSVPAWLDGDFVRQNCASFGNIDGAKYDYVEHLFDCIPMVGRYLIQNGKVKYSNKQYLTRQNGMWKHFNQNMSLCKVRWRTLFSEIDQDAYAQSRTTRFNSSLFLSPTVNFWKSRPQDPVFAVTESIFSPTELKLRPDLGIIDIYQGFKSTEFPEYFKYGNNVRGFYDNPAHEQVDRDGTIWTSTLEIEPPVDTPTKKHSGLEVAVIVYTIKGDNRTMAGRHVLGKYSVTNCSNLTQEEKNVMPGYSHFVQTTTGHILVPQTSYRFDYCLDYQNQKKVMPGFLKSYKWHPDVNTSILIFERSNMSKVHHVYLPYAKFFSHDINAFEDQSYIYLDTLAYDNADAYLKVPKIKEALSNFNWAASFLRVAIDKRTWSFEATRSGPLTKNDPYGKAEFPMINYDNYHQAETRFVYFVANALYQGAKIGKLNAKTKEVIYWVPPLGYYPQEPIFVPENGATAEDQGIILCSGPVSNPAGTSFLAILNATNLAQIALVKNPNAAPFGLHNRFYKNPTPQATTKAPGPTKRPTTKPSAAMANFGNKILLLCVMVFARYF